MARFKPMNTDSVVVPSGKKKVLFIMRNLGKGGAEKVLSILLSHLDRSRIEMSCIFYDSEQVYRVPEDVKIYSLGLPGTGQFLKKVVRSVMRIFQIKKIIDMDHSDVVFSFLNTVNVVTIVATLLSRRRPKLIISERNTLSVHSLGLDRTAKYLIKKLYPRAHKIVAVSKGVKKDLVSHFGLPEEKITVINNPLDIKEVIELAQEEVNEHKWFQENIPIILNVGSLSEKKGQKFLLRAFMIIRNKFSARLVILGEGDRESELKQMAVELGIGDEVAFLGFQSNPYKFMAKSSVFVLSSLWEGLPNVILEAMACGVPVVSTDCPSGPNEIIRDQIDGLLVPIKDEIGLAEAIMHILGNKNFAERVSANAFEGVTRFSAPKIAEEYCRLIVS